MDQTKRRRITVMAAAIVSLSAVLPTIASAHMGGGGRMGGGHMGGGFGHGPVMRGGFQGDRGYGMHNPYQWGGYRPSGYRWGGGYRWGYNHWSGGYPVRYLPCPYGRGLIRNAFGVCTFHGIRPL